MDLNLNPEIRALLAAPDILQCKRILCIQPHPDDNEIGMGGTVAALAARGCEIHYLTVTNGDQGNKDHTATPEQTAAVRHAETEAAGRHLGATSFYELGHPDGTLFNILELSVEIAGVIRRAKPDAIFAPDPWLFYEAHLDHIVTGRAAANAFLMSGRANFDDGGATEPWSANAIAYYYTANPNTVVDISNFFEKKFEAIALHDSQMEPGILDMYRLFFTMKGQELAQGKGFALGEGFKVLGGVHCHCFPDTMRI